MKIIIVAGGSGKRFWPISRKKLPKIFIPLFNGTSTFQLQVKRVKKFVKPEEIFVATNEKYVSIVKKQTPSIPTSNIIAEPEKRDLLAALGFALIHLRKRGINEPVMALASDHLIKRIDVFERGVKAGKKIVSENPKKIVFFGEKPLYATNNLGWINIGKPLKQVEKVNVVEYKKWIYRPEIEKCKKMFETGQWLWNINYEIFNVDFVLKLIGKHFPTTYRKLLKIEKGLGTKNESQIIKKIYPTLEEAHSDEIWKKTKPSQAVVLKLNMGWSNPGTLFALKKALQVKKNDNVTRGNVHSYKSKDCLVFNYENKKLVTTMNLEGMVVVNTDDAMLVVHKNHVRFLSDMLKEFEGTKMEKYL